MRIMLLFPLLFLGSLPHPGQIGAQMFDPYFGLYDGGMGMYGGGLGYANPAYLYSSSPLGHGNSFSGYGAGLFGTPNAMPNPFNPFGLGQPNFMELGGSPFGALNPAPQLGGPSMNPFGAGFLSALGLGANNGANLMPQQQQQANPFQIANNNAGNSAAFGRQFRSRYGTAGSLIRGGNELEKSTSSLFAPPPSSGCNGGVGGLFALGRDCSGGGGDTKKD